MCHIPKGSFYVLIFPFISYLFGEGGGTSQLLIWILSAILSILYTNNNYKAVRNNIFKKQSISVSAKLKVFSSLLSLIELYIIWLSPVRQLEITAATTQFQTVPFFLPEFQKWHLFLLHSLTQKQNCNAALSPLSPPLYRFSWELKPGSGKRAGKSCPITHNTVFTLR